MTPSDRDLVRKRADNRCEYCSTPQNALFLPFEIDHVIAVQHGGADAVENLSLACLRCNKQKGPNLASIDPSTGLIVRLFNPRTDRWSEHFTLVDGRIGGITDIGRTTVRLLQVNDPKRIRIRQLRPN